MTAIIVLIDKHQNPKGRQLIQSHRSLIVKSECCGTEIDKSDVGMGYDDICVGCGDKIGFNKAGWGSFVNGIDMNTSSRGVGRWAEWALHWFGLEDFEIEVTE